MTVSTTDASLERRVPAQIDPRIRARRIEVQRKVGRRRLQHVLDLGLVLVVAAGFALALRSPLLDVDAVAVRGAGHTPVRLVRAEAGIGRGDQLMDVDLRSAGERVAALPWVDDVRLHRRIDGVVELTITERTAVAVVGDGASAVLVDRDGRVVSLAADALDLVPGAVRISGPDVTAEPGEFLGRDVEGALALATRLSEAGLALHLEVGGTAGDDLVGTLDSGIRVRFGSATLLDAKVRSLRTVLARVDLACADVIDLRSRGSAVLTRDEACS